MKAIIQNRRILTVLLTLVLAAPLGLIHANAADKGAVSQSRALQAEVNQFNYFDQVYPRLNDKNHVFKTATYEDIVHLFESEGNFAVLFGGAWSGQTQATIGFINQVAKEQGIKTIYNFDTKLDGTALDIADTGSPYAYKYVDLANKYLKNLNLYDKDIAANNVSYQKEDGTTVAANKINAPFLFIYNKDHKGNDGEPAPIVSYLNESKVWEDFLTNGALDASKVTAYKKLVSDTLGTVANYSVIDESDYIKEAFNLNYAGENPGKVIFNEQDADLVYEHVTYHQLKEILKSNGNYLLFFGGSWCPNTQALIKYVNEYAKEHGIEKIYFFDTKLDGGVEVREAGNNTGGPKGDNPHYTEVLQIRTTDHPYAKLYVDLVNNYLTNIITENNSAENPRTINYTNTFGQVVSGDRLQVPYLFSYNRSNKDVNGTSAPILGHIELMYSWSNIQPDYVKEGEDFVAGARYQNLIKALDALFARLEATTVRLTSTKATSSTNADGAINGTSTALEYRLVGESEYKKVTGGSITGLIPGTYEVRYASKPGYQGPTTKNGATAKLYPAGQAVQIQVRSGEYADVSADAWYYPAVDYLASRNITAGTQSEGFGPNVKLNRGQFVVLLLKAYGIQPEAAGADNFADAGDTYYTGYLAAAKRLGIAGGSGDNRFNPEAEISRQDLAALLYRALGVLDRLPAGATAGTLEGYSDAANIAGYAEPAFTALVKAGIIGGNGGKLNPEGTSTRAETAQILYNLLTK